MSSELHEDLIALGLRGVAASLDDLTARTTKARSSPIQLFEELVRIEKVDRARPGLERRQARSRIGTFKPMADFDWNWPSKVDRAAVERVLSLAFVDEGANVIVVGAHGLGKTMLLKNIAHQAVLNGSTVLCVTAAKLLNDLSAQESPRALERRLKHYTRIAVLCVDSCEVPGYVELAQQQA